MKLFTACLATESSDLTPIAMTNENWKLERSDDQDVNPSSYREVLILFREMAEAKGWKVAEGLCASAVPGGRIVRSVYENLREIILNDLRQAMPVDGVLLNLHGAALAHGYDDVEGDLLEYIRDITGPDIPIGVELDPHCHLSEKMMEHATAIILYKTFLHIDTKERAVELFNLIADTLEGRVKPVMALFDCRMMDRLVDESFEPMKSFLNTVCAREREPGILSISPVHGFPLAAVAEMGNKMLVIADNDSDLARNTAEELGMAFYEIRGQQSQYLSVDTALDKAQEKAVNGEKCIQLLEWSDLAGCGFPTDGTELLQAMFERGMTDVAVGLLWDPLAVSICDGAGVGAELMLRIGGKACLHSGAPMDLNVVVEKIHKEAVINTWMGDMNLGDTVVVRSGDTHIIMVSNRAQGYLPEAFRSLGVEPNDKQYLLVKHTHGEDCIDVWGASLDLKQWSDTGAINRPKWPWDENPFTGV